MAFRSSNAKAVLDSLSEIPGWSDVIAHLVKTAPNDSIYTRKLMWRNPQPHWTSPHGFVCQIGDAAHTFLPTSGNGATQAMEDGIYLAACLQLSGKDEIPLATRVFNKLR